MQKDYKDYIELETPVEGDERRYELLSEVLNGSTFLPKTVTYKDIDEAFTEWVEKQLVITSDDGIEFPTIIMYSNQRFSEYTQTWKHTDNNNNIMLNFKSINRDINPEFGNIQQHMWNIPGDNRFYLIKRQIVLDDNGSESYLDLKMRQPTSIDFNFKLSVFTTKFDAINTFNTMVNKAFRARQCYISPNGHEMPMTLEGINDESQYNIDDRQFYSQTFNIKVMGYIITEDDYRVEQVPLKKSTTLPFLTLKKHIPEIDIDECTDENDDIKLTITFDTKTSAPYAKFDMDTNLKIKNIELENLYRNYKILINGELCDNITDVTLYDKDEITIKASKQIKNNEAKFIIIGKEENF